MAIIIVLAASPACEAELETMGFKKREVWAKMAPPGPTPEAIEKGESEMFRMKSPPFQFLVKSWWGMGPG